MNITYTGSGYLIGPTTGNQLNIPGKDNHLIRMRVKRLNDGGNWQGVIEWSGYDPLRAQRGNRVNLNFSNTRISQINPDPNIDNNMVVLEWDMSKSGDADGYWNDCIIEMISVKLSDSDSSEFEIDWIEIGGLKAHKYSDGILKMPLRTEKSERRARGTYAKIKYSAKTTEKFNIFAILAKYRKTY